MLAALLQGDEVDAASPKADMEPKEDCEAALDTLSDCLQAYYGIREERLGATGTWSKTPAGTIPAPAAPVRNTKSAA